MPTKKRRLKCYAVPSKNLPGSKTCYDIKLKPGGSICFSHQKNLADATEAEAQRSVSEPPNQELLEGINDISLKIKEPDLLGRRLIN